MLTLKILIMDIIIQSLGFKSSESLENFIREKINTIKEDKMIRANVVLFKGPATNPENDYCEIRLEVPGNDHFVKKHSQYFEVAVTECIDILSQMISKAKGKKAKFDQNNADIIEDDFSETGDIELEDVVK